MILILIWGIGVAISLALLIGTFVLFSNVKDIRELLIEQNENIEALVKLGIINNDKQN